MARTNGVGLDAFDAAGPLILVALGVLLLVVWGLVTLVVDLPTGVSYLLSGTGFGSLVSGLAWGGLLKRDAGRAGRRG